MKRSYNDTLSLELNLLLLFIRVFPHTVIVSYSRAILGYAYITKPPCFTLLCNPPSKFKRMVMPF